MEHFQGVLFNEDGRIMPRGERASLGFQKEVTKTYWIRGSKFLLPLCQHLSTMYYMEGARVRFIECLK